MPRKIDGDTAISKYVLVVKAEGMSDANIEHATRPVGFLRDYLGRIEDVADIETDGLRGFILALQQKQRWSSHPTIKSRGKLAVNSTGCYVRAIKAFWGWRQEELRSCDNLY